MGVVMFCNFFINLDQTHGLLGKIQTLQHSLRSCCKVWICPPKPLVRSILVDEKITKLLPHPYLYVNSYYWHRRFSNWTLECKQKYPCYDCSYYRRIKWICVQQNRIIAHIITAQSKHVPQKWYYRSPFFYDYWKVWEHASIM